MRNFLKSIKGKLCTIALAVVLLCGIGGGAYGLWRHAQPKFHDVTVELGTTVIGIDQFLTEFASADKAVFVTDVSTIDIGRVGRTELEMGYGRQRETVTLTVEDTTPPEAVFVASKTVKTDYKPRASDFVESSYDLSGTTASFLNPVTIPGDYSDLAVTVVVTDGAGNAVQQDCTLSFAFLREEATLELGGTLTRADLLLCPAKDGAMIRESVLDEINSGGVGTYTVTCGTDAKTMTCRVTVQDTTAPALTLQDVHIYAGTTAELEDFVVAAEDLSGDVTLRYVTEPDFSQEGRQVVSIEAKDLYGNAATAEAEINITSDNDPPAIYGLSTLTLAKNSAPPDYMDGVSAWDERDGSRAVSCDAAGVDYSKAGYYYVTYTASDTSGNYASARRKVEILRDEADLAALIAVEAAKAGTSDPMGLCQYVRNRISYSSDWGGSDPVWNGFSSGSGNCYVHALCLQALLSYNGYSSQLIWTTDETHYWLVVNVGVWRHIDPTPYGVHGTTGLMTDDERFETLSGIPGRDWDRTLWPACG